MRVVEEGLGCVEHIPRIERGSKRGRKSEGKQEIRREGED